jgi:integrase
MLRDSWPGRARRAAAAGWRLRRGWRAYARLVVALAVLLTSALPGYYNRRDLFKHWITKRQRANEPCTRLLGRLHRRGVLRRHGRRRGVLLRHGLLRRCPNRMLRRRKVGPDRDRALSRERVDELLARESIPLRDRLLWRMLYETAARASELLDLDVPDLDLPNRRARVTRKGGAQDVIVWQTGTARLLPRYLRGRTDGPLFVTERKARSVAGVGPLQPRPGPARVQAGARRLQGGLRRRDPAPAAAQRAHP